MKKILDKLARYVFERLPVLKAFDGNKRFIGNVLQVAAGVIALLAQYFPETPYLSVANAIVVGALGYFTRLFGDIHADAKEREG